MKKTQKLYRYVALLFAAVFVSTVVFTGVKPELASAAPYSKDTVEQRSKAWLYGRAIGLCFKENGLKDGINNDLIDEDHAESGEWFNGQGEGGKNVGTILNNEVEGNGDDGIVDCSESDLVTKALSALDLDWKDVLCTMGFTRDTAGPAGDSCKGGSGHFRWSGGTESNKIQDEWNKIFREKYLEGKGIQDSLSPGMRYYINLETFRLGCRADFKELYTDQSLKGDKKYKSPLYNSKDDKIEQWYVETKDGNDNIDTGGNGYFASNNKKRCQDLESDLDKYIDAYVKEIKDNKAAGINDGTTGDDRSRSNTEASCESEGGPLAWFLCQVIGGILDGIVDTLDTWVNNLLFVDGDRYKGAEIEQAWETMRNIALLILVPIMMFMVIGTAINFGPFDPYTVKKALPRMFFATIFIVLSLPITQFGVALSNIAGQGLGNIIINASPTDTSSIGEILAAHQASTTLAGFGGLVVTTAAVLSGALTIGIVGSFALVTAVGLFIGFVILVLRQVLLIMLMVIAPLAILAWIFPGNDKLWGLWKGTFIAMLMAYPIIAILLASGKFVAGLFG